MGSVLEPLSLLTRLLRPAPLWVRLPAEAGCGAQGGEGVWTRPETGARVNGRGSSAGVRWVCCHFSHRRTQHDLEVIMKIGSSGSTEFGKKRRRRPNCPRWVRCCSAARRRPAAPHTPGGPRPALSDAPCPCRESWRRRPRVFGPRLGLVPSPSALPSLSLLPPG